jgi:hypothetical protein
MLRQMCIRGQATNHDGKKGGRAVLLKVAHWHLQDYLKRIKSCGLELEFGNRISWDGRRNMKSANQIKAFYCFSITVAAFRSLFMTAAAISPSSFMPSTYITSTPL